MTETPSSHLETPRFLDAGEAALVVEFGATVDPAINDRVLALDAALRARTLQGVTETVPTYRSLMIHYDPLALDRDALVEAVKGLSRAEAAERAPGRAWIVPCCYEPAFGEDLAEVADKVGLTPDKVVALHSGAEYRVYMYGFAPGFAYLGGLPQALGLPRRPTPRPPHPEGALMIGGGLAAVASFPMPTGWYVLARTPERLFSARRDPTFLFEAGDTLHFEAVDAAAFAELDARAGAGEVVARLVEPQA